MKKSLAIIGVRGIPVVYSGFETFAEELSVRLVKRGWDVCVFCRKHAMKNGMNSYNGVRLITLPSVFTKSLDTLSHSALSTLYSCCMTPKPNVIYYLGVGSSIFSFIPRMFGIKTIVNVDGLDWKRGKWGKTASWFLRISEILAIKLSNLAMTDSNFIKEYYLKTYHQKMPVIPYGYSSLKTRISILKQFEVERGKYLIWTGRLVPDNHLDELIRAYTKAKTKMPLLVLGDSPNEDVYKSKLQTLASSFNIRFVGFVDRLTYASLVANSLAYIETKRSGGTHPSLVESMGHGCLILSNNHRSHRDVLGDTAIYYLKGNVVDLGDKLKVITSSKFEDTRRKLSVATKYRAQSYYLWDRIIDKYEILFASLLS